MYEFTDLQPQNAFDDVVTTYERHAHRYEGVRVRAVALLHDGAMQVVIWSARACLRTSPVVRAHDLVYPDARFLERWIEPADFRAFLRSAWSDGVVADLPARAKNVHTPRVARERLPARNKYDDQAGVGWERGGMESQLGFRGGLLVSFGQPVFEDVYDGIGTWLEVRDWRGSGDGRMGNSMIFLPESRATFSRFARVEGGPIDAVVSRAADYDGALRVKGTLSGPGGHERIDATVEGECARIGVPADVRAIELCLVAHDDSVLDLHSESEAGVRGVGPALHSEPVATAASRELRRVIDDGENDLVEFKPYVELHSPKWKELPETVIAFANARGGRLLVGVTDHGVVEGVETPLEALAGRPKVGSDPLQWYVREISSRLRHLVSPTPVFSVDVMQIEGHQILAIDVKEGSDKPCEHVDTHEMFTRRGATDRLATRAELEAIFRGSGETGHPRHRRR